MALMVHPVHSFFFIRNQFIRNQGSTPNFFKKLEGWNGADLRNFQISKFPENGLEKRKYSFVDAYDAHETRKGF